MEELTIKNSSYADIGKFIDKINELIKKSPIDQKEVCCPNITDDNYYNAMLRKVYSLLTSISECVPNFELTDLIKYAINNHHTQEGNMAKILLNFMFFNYYKPDVKRSQNRYIIRDLLLLFDKESPIGVFCIKMQNRFHALDIFKAESQNELEQILKSISKSSKCYHYGIKKLVVFYKNKINNLNDPDNIRSFITRKQESGLYLKSVKPGRDFLYYAEKLIEGLEVVKSNIMAYNANYLKGLTDSERSINSKFRLKQRM